MDVNMWRGQQAQLGGEGGLAPFCSAVRPQCLPAVSAPHNLQRVEASQPCPSCSEALGLM